MPKPLPIIYSEVSQYYFILRVINGGVRLKKRAHPPGSVSNTERTGAILKRVLVGDTTHLYDRVLYSLLHKVDVGPLDLVVKVAEPVTKGLGLELALLSNETRPPRVAAYNTDVPKHKPHDFVGEPIAGVVWLPHKRMWRATDTTGTHIGTFKFYYDACLARMRATGQVVGDPSQGGPLYPSPSMSYIARAKNKPVPKAYRHRIGYDKQQDVYRVHKDGKTILCTKTLHEAIKELAK